MIIANYVMEEKRHFVIILQTISCAACLGDPNEGKAPHLHQTSRSALKDLVTLKQCRSWMSPDAAMASAVRLQERLFFRI